MSAVSSANEVAVIVGGGPGVSASCARCFSREGMKVVVAARNPDKPVLKALEEECGVVRRTCDATNAESVAALFDSVAEQLGLDKEVRTVLFQIKCRPE